MLFVLSPAKTLDESPAPAGVRCTQPLFAADAAKLAAKLATVSPADLRALMSISAPLATQNIARYKAFRSAAEKPALFSFNGPAYKALDAGGALHPEHLEWVQSHLCVQRAAGVRGLRCLALPPFRLLAAPRSRRARRQRDAGLGDAMP